jgi:tRNA A-37 threonylcarbamoyl transferase component Bud32
MQRRTISRQDYEAIEVSGRSLLPPKHGYPCVIIHPDQTVTKIWARKTGLFSSARWSPYARRFINNATKLREHGVPAPEILEHLEIEGTHVQLVRYRELAGRSIRDLIKNDPGQADIEGLAKFIYGLHEQGILYRSIHLGNVIQMPEGKFGLIDFTDVRFSRKPVPHLARAANIAMPLKYRDDVDRMNEADLPSLLECYLTRYRPGVAERLSFVRAVEERTKG